MSMSWVKRRTSQAEVDERRRSTAGLGCVVIGWKHGMGSYAKRLVSHKPSISVSARGGSSWDGVGRHNGASAV